MSDQKPYLPFAFGRMPGWAISLTVAITATCIAILAMASVYSQARKHRAEEYKNCLALHARQSAFITGFGQLRDADLTILTVTSATRANRPTTPAGRAIVTAVRQQITAYDKLLLIAAKDQKVDCSTLK